MNRKYFDQKKNYVFFMPNFNVGGAEKFFIQLANELVSEGCQVSILAATAHGPLMILLDKKVEVVNLHASRVIFSLPKVLKYFWSKKKTDIHLVTTMYHCNIIGCIVKFIFPSISLTIRESTSSDFYKKYFSALTYMSFKILCRLFYRMADDIVFPAKAMRDAFISDVCALDLNKVRVIPNYINESELQLKASESIDPTVWIKKHSKVIINVGRLDKNKNQILILKAMTHLNDIDVEFIQLGSGPEENDLKQFVQDAGLSDKVRFLGFQENPYKFLKAADVFVLSSFTEGYPNVLVQAKFFGLAIVALDCPTGPAEILDGYESGILLDMNHQSLDVVLAEKLRGLLSRCAD